VVVPEYTVCVTVYSLIKFYVSIFTFYFTQSSRLITALIIPHHIYLQEKNDQQKLETKQFQFLV